MFALIIDHSRFVNNALYNRRHSDLIATTTFTHTHTHTQTHTHTNTNTNTQTHTRARTHTQVYLSCFPHKPLQSCTNCAIMHHNSARAGPNLVYCGGCCSRLLLLHPSSTSTDAVHMLALLVPINWCKYIYSIHFYMCDYSLKFVVWWYTYIGCSGSRMSGCLLQL